ncbi:MAG TPA: serpin family protein [Polyangiaceae bacterium]
MTTRKILSAAALFAAAGCSGGTAADNGSADAHGVTIAQSSVARVAASEVSAAELNAAVAASNAFAVDLYAQVLKDKQGKNVLTSPISASLALTMTYAGAKGPTQAEMAAALHFDPQAGDAVFAGQNALSQALNARGESALANARQSAAQGQQAAPAESDYQLQVVNSVWGEQTYTWETPFLATLAANYGTGVYQQNFRSAYEPARALINSWVSEHTNDKINDLLPQGSLDDLTRMVLVNAIHLKLPWQANFLAQATSAATFTRADASTISADFMHRQADLAYVDDGQAQVVALPLANRELQVVIALPHADVTLSNYEASLSATSAALRIPPSTAQVALALPKATFTSPSVSLADALKALGMTQAFDENSANFSGLCANPPDGSQLHLSDVLQKSMIAMQENGVEAAAATAVVVAGTTSIVVEPPHPVEMNVNRPYLVAIVDAPTGAVLMLGQIQDPTDAGAP